MRQGQHQIVDTESLLPILEPAAQLPDPSQRPEGTQQVLGPSRGIGPEASETTLARRGGTGSPEGQNQEAQPCPVLRGVDRTGHERPSFGPILDALPKGSRVALVTMVGSLCPVTLGHVQGFLEARRIFLGEKGVPRPKHLEAFDEVVGLLALNSDGHVRGKLAQMGEQYLCYEERRRLVELATADYLWLEYDAREFGRLEHRWPALEFVHYSLNGADDVLKYRKYTWGGPRSRYITMGRPGDTAGVRKGMEKAGVDPERGYFILGPELPDISATAARRKLRSGEDEAGLQELLHPDVINWCKTNGPYQPRHRHPSQPDEGRGRAVRKAAEEWEKKIRGKVSGRFNSGRKV